MVIRSLKRFVKVMREYISVTERSWIEVIREIGNGRNQFGEKPSTGVGKYQTESDLESEDKQIVGAGPQPEDFSNLVSQVPKTAVPFGQEVEE